VEDVGVDHAVAMLVITRRSTERIARVGFEMASGRRRKLTVVHKGNVVRAYKYFRDVCMEVAAGYPEVEVSEMYVDNAAYQLVVNPQSFDVLLTPNMFGDILSDQAAGVVGDNRSGGGRPTSVTASGCLSPYTAPPPASTPSKLILLHSFWRRR
jgi:isocitrate/isopropylmalate dehydrogenase